MNDNNLQDGQWSPERIHGLRMALNRTQQEKATLIGVTERTIFRWEKGYAQPRHKMIRRLKKIEGKLMSQSLKGKERLASILKEGKQGTPNEYRQIRERIRGNRQSAQEEMNITLRETHKALGNSWRLLHRSNDLFRQK